MTHRGTSPRDSGLRHLLIISRFFFTRCIVSPLPVGYTIANEPRHTKWPIVEVWCAQAWPLALSSLLVSIPRPFFNGCAGFQKYDFSPEAETAKAEGS